jgi:hypothetical protein
MDSPSRRRRGRGHSRMLGKLYQSGSSTPASHETPPHTQGTHALASKTQRYARATPANAGNSRATSSTDSASTSHPRIPEKHNRMAGQVEIDKGTPLQTQGTRGKVDAGMGNMRITPACAGNPVTWSPLRSSDTAHPRRRGEHRLHDHVFASTPRDTPACAGIAHPESSEWRYRPDYP